MSTALSCTCKDDTKNLFEAIFGGLSKSEYKDAQDDYNEKMKVIEEKRYHTLKDVQSGKFDDKMIEIEVEDNTPPMLEVFSQGSGMEEMGINMQDVFGGLFPQKERREG